MVAIASMILGSIGCASIKTNPNAQTAITGAAALGTAYDLQQRPKDLPYFIAAEQELYSVANGTNIVTAKNIDAVMANAGQTNPLVNSALITGIQLANGFIAANSTTNNASVNVVCGWLADGIAQSAGIQLKQLKVSK